jgi:transposase InsO family protein
LTFIDDLSHFTWFYFIKNTNILFEKFKEFRAFSEKKCGRPIKCLGSDNGGEYVNRTFEEYLVRYSIDWKQLVPHTPQQNGATECKNQMLLEMARCILQAKDLPRSFWDEAVYCVNYLLNHISTQDVSSMTPVE